MGVVGSGLVSAVSPHSQRSQRLGVERIAQADSRRRRRARRVGAENFNLGHYRVVRLRQ